MSDYIPPSGPPPPRVPEGWKAIWNQQYSEWFYVNTYTKESTWEKPTAPARGHGDDAAPGAPPPSYQSGPNAPNVSDTKKTHLDSNNPYNHGAGSGETDEELARRLQREEDERNRGTGHSPNPAAYGNTADRGQSNSYYQNQSQPSQQSGLQGGYPGGPTPGSNVNSYTSSSTTAQRSSGGGLFGKLKDKLGSAGGSGGYPSKPAGYGQQPGGYMPQQQGYGGYPQQGYGGYPQQHGYGGYPQHGMMGMPAKKKAGMGMGGAAALGVGGGLVGGMLLADAMDDHDQGGYDDGGDMGGDMGGDF